jgi:hypothetical protein
MAQNSRLLIRLVAHQFGLLRSKAIDAPEVLKPDEQIVYPRSCKMWVKNEAEKSYTVS